MIGTKNRKTGFNIHDARLIRLWNPETRRYLHLSADMETDGTSYAWFGYRHQANALRDRAAVRGDDWPYQVKA